MCRHEVYESGFVVRSEGPQQHERCDLEVDLQFEGLQGVDGKRLRQPAPLQRGWTAVEYHVEGAEMNGIRRPAWG